MKKIGWRVWTLFVSAFLVTLIVTAPATLLARVVEGSSSGRLVLANATGTMWRGSATPAIRQRTGGLLALEKLHWDIAILPLFSGKMSIELRWDNVEQMQPMVVTASFTQTELRNAVLPLHAGFLGELLPLLALEKLHWDIALLPLFTGKLSIEFRWDNVEQMQPMVVTASFAQAELRNAVLPLHAGFLGELLPLLQPVQLSGKMLIRSELFTITRQGMSGSAVADWIHAGSVLSSVNPLGSYRINLAGAGERVDVSLLTTSGVLLLEGTGSVSSGRGLSFQGTARASAKSNGSIDELLNNFGPESEPGVRSLNLMR